MNLKKVNSSFTSRSKLINEFEKNIKIKFIGIIFQNIKSYQKNLLKSFKKT